MPREREVVRRVWLEPSQYRVVVAVSATRHVIVGGELAIPLGCPIHHRADYVYISLSEDGGGGGRDVDDGGAGHKDFGDIGGTGLCTGGDCRGQSQYRCESRPTLQYAVNYGGVALFAGVVAAWLRSDRLLLSVESSNINIALARLL